MLLRLPVKVHADVVGSILLFAALAFLPMASSAMTLSEKWRAEEQRFRILSGSICDECDPRPIGLRRSSKHYSARVDPIAILENSSRATAKYLASASSMARIVPTPVVNRALASINQRVSRRHAHILSRRRLAKLVRTRRYAALMSRQKAQAAAIAAAARFKVELGRVEQQPQ